MCYSEELTERHFNQVEAARYLNKSLRWFQLQLTGPHPPPGFKIGKAWLFKKSELDRWLEQFRAGADLDKIVDAVMADLGAST
jgi:Helix-turn-helix domain